MISLSIKSIIIYQSVFFQHHYMTGFGHGLTIIVQMTSVNQIVKGVIHTVLQHATRIKKHVIQVSMEHVLIKFAGKEFFHTLFFE